MTPEEAQVEVVSGEAPPFPVIGVCASAGGVEAFQALLADLPEDFQAALVLLHHMAPDHRSHLAEILGRSSPLPVADVVDGVRLEPGHVYVGVANRLVEVHGDTLRLVEPESDAQRFRALDLFLQSLAASSQQRAIGVVLSGTGSAGTAGLQAIKAHGGLTFAQSPATARFGSMPLNAYRGGHVDFQGAPKMIARELVRITRDPWIMPGEAGRGDENPDAMHRIFNLLRRATQVDFSGYKGATMQRRLNRRRILRRQGNLEDYLQVLQREPDEMRVLYTDLLINVTQFFRHASSFEALGAHLEVAFRDRAATDTVRVWVPACATGQEAYSLAMVLLEVRDRLDADWSIKVFGTDLSEASIAKARRGRYDDNIETEVSPERLARYFDKEDGAYRVNRALRDLCIFSVHNVIQDPPFSRIDVLSCRNLLIYLRAPIQEMVLTSFHYALAKQGILTLGESESLGAMREFYLDVDAGHRIYGRKDAPRPTRRVPPASLGHVLDASAGAVKRAEPGLRSEVDQFLLRHHAPPAVVINEALDILQFRGDTSPFLAPASGNASLNLLRMARSGLDIELRMAWQEAKDSKDPVRRECRFLEGDTWRHVDVLIAPVSTGSPRRHIVVFQAKPLPERAPEVGPPGDVDPQEMRRLQRDLADTREHLQVSLETTETANEGLRTANEEALSSNEELQSTNQELQTTMEELQSINEELSTVNDELQTRNDDLYRLNNDLENLVRGVGLPILFLDADLVIGRFTPQAEELLRLVGSDVGRPVGDVQPSIGFPDLEGAIRDVVRTGEPVHEEVEAADGTWYKMDISPYRVREDVIEGAVVVLTDVDELRRRFEAVSLLTDVGRAITQADDFDQALVAAMQVIAEDQKWVGAEAWVPDGDALVMRQAWTAEEGVRTLLEAGKSLRLAADEDLPGKAWRGRRIVAADRLGEDGSFGRHAEAKAAGLTGALVVPVMADDAVVMMLLLYSRATPARRERNRKILDIIAAQVGITFRSRLADDRLARQAETLRRLNQELDDFARILAHDVSNPTRSARMYLELVDAEAMGSEDRAHMEQAGRLLRRLEAMVDHLVEFSRGQHVEAAVLDVRMADILDDVESALAARIKKHHVQITRKGDVALRVDTAVLHHALANVLDNAIKFRHPKRKPHIQIETTQDGGDVRVRIRDNGKGMDETSLASAFVMFWQKEVKDGQGMGLAIARRMLGRIDGTIDATAVLGKGCVFTITVPATPHRV